MLFSLLQSWPKAHRRNKSLCTEEGRGEGSHLFRSVCDVNKEVQKYEAGLKEVDGCK
jgi:hypothetical protein